MRHPYFALPTPIVIGHRGCAGVAPENTLVGFTRALELGAAILESDVQLTRDGVPVLLHDPEVDRVTDGSGAIAELPLAEVHGLDAGHHFPAPDAAGDRPYRGQGLRIPTLDEAFEAFPGVRFNLEIKSERAEAIEATCAVVAQHDRAALTLLTAEKGARNFELKRELATRKLHTAIGASIDDVVAVIRSANDGSAPATDAMALQIPLEFANRPLVTRALVDHAHAHDIQVHVWTINDEAEMAALLDLGVDGLISDFPARVGDLIERRRRGPLA